MPNSISSRGRHRPRPILAATLAAACLLAGLAAGPAAAKEGLEAILDAPIAQDTPAGTALLVGVTLLAPGEDGTLTPIEGVPVYLELTGPDGWGTRAPGTAEGGPGHYVFVVRVPEGGPRVLEVGVSGEEDLPFPLAGEGIAPGPMSVSTAQAAPADRAALADLLTTVTEPSPGWTAVAIAAGIAVLVLVLAGSALAFRLRRRDHHLAAPGLG